MDFEFRVGDSFWIQCEVKKGAFPDERLVRLHSAYGDWVAFVASHFLKDSNLLEGRTEVPAVVVEVTGDHFLARLPGTPVTASLFKDTIPSRANSGGALQA